jgi:hypothetical protein
MDGATPVLENDRIPAVDIDDPVRRQDEGRQRAAHSEGETMATQSQYLLSVFMNEDDEAPSDVDMQRIYQQVEDVNNELRSAGAWVFAGGLHPASTATVVRTENGSPVTTDGPYAETKEQLGGFWVIKADDLDAALAWAGKASAACEGPVEVRPFGDEPKA